MNFNLHLKSRSIDDNQKSQNPIYFNWSAANLDNLAPHHQDSCSTICAAILPYLCYKSARRIQISLHIHAIMILIVPGLKSEVQLRKLISKQRAITMQC